MAITHSTEQNVRGVTYDAKSRLVQATGPYGDVAREDYGYDDNDNRLSLAQRDTATAPNPTRLVTSTIAAGSNRLASQSIAGPSGTTSRSFTYNGRGDVTAEARDGAGVTASYDAYGRLATYTRTGTPAFAMLYSGTDERVQVSVDGTPRRFMHDESGRVIGEYGATGTAFAEHVWLMPDTDEGGWEPLALLGASTLSYVHGDHLGVPVVITDGAGDQVNAMQADPFGQRFYTASASAPRTSLAFPGQIIDIADRHYNLYRDYDPTLGRYLQADPIGLDGGDNVYGYVGGNPLNRVDPTGEFANLWIGGITGAATGYLISLMTGECYDLDDALIDAALGATGAGLVAKLEKLRELRKLRTLASERGLVPNKINSQIEDYINPTNPIERMKIKLVPSLNAPGSLSQGARVEYRVAPGTFQNPFTGGVGKTAKYSHVPIGIPSRAGSLAGGAAGGVLGQGLCGCSK